MSKNAPKQSSYIQMVSNEWLSLGDGWGYHRLWIIHRWQWLIISLTPIKPSFTWIMPSGSTCFRTGPVMPSRRETKLLFKGGISENPQRHPRETTMHDSINVSAVSICTWHVAHTSTEEYMCTCYYHLLSLLTCFTYAWSPPIHGQIEWRWGLLY